MRFAVADIPSPSRDAWDIGPLTIHVYGIVIVTAVLVATYIFGRRLDARGIGTMDDAVTLGVTGAAAGLIGGRIYHVATSWNAYSDRLGDIPRIWEGGLGIPGALIAGVVVGSLVARRRGIPIGEALNCAAPAIAIGQAIGRLGNWFNQELYGRATTLPWGLQIDEAHRQPGHLGESTYHPTFLYEALWNLALAGLLIMVDRRRTVGPGRLFALQITLYGVGRFWIEGLRIDPADTVGGLRWNQWMAAAAVVGGLTYLFLTRNREDHTAQIDVS